MHEPPSINADAVRIFLEADGIVMEFGRRTTAQSRDGEVLEGISRIKVPPQTFRRMGMSLHDVIRHLPSDPPTSTGSPTPPTRSTPPSSEGLGAKPSLERLLEPTSNLPSSSAPPPAASLEARRVYDLVTKLGLPHVHERSFRMRPGELLPNRFLLSVACPNDGRASAQVFTCLFEELRLPTLFMAAACRHIPAARCIHIGFEGDGSTPLIKVYLEIGGPDKIDASDPRAAVLEHIAYKWDPGNEERRAVGRYWWYPHLTASELKHRVAAMHKGTDPEAQDIVHTVVDMAAKRMPEQDIHYLEIEEEGNSRRSYSINFYDACLQVRDLYPMLSRMRRLFNVPAGQFQMLYDQIKKRRFGHLAGGLHRNGKGFFNVYYGPQFFDQGQEGPWRSALLRSESGRLGA